MQLNKITLVLLLFFIQTIFADIAICKDAEVIFVDIEGQSLKDAEDIELACDLLGVRFKAHYIRTKNDTEILKSITALHDKEVLILAGRVLKYLNKDIVSMFSQSDRKSKILILGINSGTDIEGLKIWSGNKIKNFRQFRLPIPTTSIKVIQNKQIARELGGLEHPLSGSGSEIVNGFELADAAKAASLIEVRDVSGKQEFPIFLKTDIAGKSVFFLSSWDKVMANEKDDLLKNMPILMFLKYSFGERCWHGINDYANLTIDDPWLREPYGYISFKDLCREAEKTPFHVTTAFIPYNYQKSHSDVIETFKQCAASLSIAIHGNNHDFSEFRDTANTRLIDKKLIAIHPDERNVLHALDRMDKFSSLTGIPYDRVMVFPRGAFTRANLGQLKKHNFLMTINSMRPHHSGDWQSDTERLRGTTLQYANFPIVLRYGIPENDDGNSEELRNVWIRMRLFLDLPVVLYTHMSFFKEGAQSFNSTAQMVNNIQPAVVWSGLGNIARHLYLQKKINENEIEVLAHTSELHIKNNYPESMKFIIKKQDDFLIPIHAVKVNGKNSAYSRDGISIRIETLIEPGCENIVQVFYRSDYQVGSFTYPDAGLDIVGIRALSDFRDIYLSKLPWGNKIVRSFYELGGVKSIPVLMLAIAGIFLLAFVGYVKYRNRKSRKIKG